MVKEIVELRGALRHHSLKHPNRWDPNKQEDYGVEASFLGSVCMGVAFPFTTEKLWDSFYVEQFVEQAKRSNCAVELAVTITVRVGDQAEEKHVNMTFPQMRLDAPLAKTVLMKVMELVDKEMPGAEVFAIRARHKSQGTELFRYDVGPSLHR